MHQIHLWLGIVSGLGVFIIALTGALYTFQNEIQDLNPNRFVREQASVIKAPSELSEIARSALPNKTLHAIKYNGPKRSAEAIFYHYNPTYYYVIYLNQYSGKVLEVKDMNKDFFRFIMQGHFYLWLPPQIGQPAVAYLTLCFLIILITGMVIWVPKNLKMTRYRIWFKWNKGTQWPKINFDLHVVAGLYATIFALIFAITGLVWGFQWFSASYYKAIGGKKQLQYSDTSPFYHKKDSVVSNENPLDKVWTILRREYPQAASLEIHHPETDSSAISANANNCYGKYWKTDYRYFDQQSLKEINFKHIYGKYSDADRSDKLFRMNYDIHTGSIFGLAGKIFAFLMSLLIASFPITGFIIWWRKAKAKRRPQRL